MSSSASTSPPDVAAASTAPVASGSPQTVPSQSRSASGVTRSCGAADTAPSPAISVNFGESNFIGTDVGATLPRHESGRSALRCDTGHVGERRESTAGMSHTPSAASIHGAPVPPTTMNSSRGFLASAAALPAGVAADTVANDVTDSRNAQYELYGVLIHSGTADYGHYYSLVRSASTPTVRESQMEDALGESCERVISPSSIAPLGMSSADLGASSSPLNDSESAWLELNDSVVRRVADINVALERDGYGSIGGTTAASAYMLCYRRIDEGADDDLCEDAFDTATRLEVVADARQFLAQRYIFDSEFSSFMGNLVLELIAKYPPSSGAGFPLLGVELVAQFTLLKCRQVNRRLADEGGVVCAQWLRVLADLVVGGDMQRTRMLELLRQPPWLMLLLATPDLTVRQLVCSELVAPILISACAEDCHLPPEDIGRRGSGTHNGGNGSGRRGPAWQFVNRILELLSAAPVLHPGKAHALIAMLRTVAGSSLQARRILLHNRLLSKVAAMLMSPTNAPETPARAATAAASASSRLAQGWADATTITALLDIVARCVPALYLVRDHPSSRPPAQQRGGINFPPVTLHTPEVIAIIFKPTLTAIIDHALAPTALGAILCHYSWDRQSTSHSFLIVVVERLNVLAQSSEAARSTAVYGILEVLNAMLDVNDSLQPARAAEIPHAILQMISEALRRGSVLSIALLCIRWLKDSGALRPLMAQWLEGKKELLSSIEHAIRASS